MSSSRIIRSYVWGFLVFIAIPILFILFLLNHMYGQTLLNISTEDRLQLQKNISTSIDNEIHQRLLAAANVAVDMEILSLANRWSMTLEPIPRSLLDIEMSTRLNRPILLISGFEVIAFYFKESNISYVFGEGEVLTPEYARHTEWYTEALNNPGRIIVDNSIRHEEGRTTITFAIHPITLVSDNQIEIIYFRFHVNFIRDFGLNQGDNIIVSTDGIILYCAIRHRDGYSIDDFPEIRDSNPFAIQYIEGERMLVTAATTPRTRWQIISIDSYREATAQMRGITIYGFLAGSAYLFFFIVFSILFYRKIIKPAVMLELQAMQYQITPHFIINTINSIKIMAMISHQSNIEKMTEAFMRLLSAVLGKSGTESTIREEIANVKNYVHIMKVRFGDKFQVEYDIHSEVEDFSIRSFLLQPIVENSIIHGFNERDSGYLIKIKGYCENDVLYFKIWDNGSGMTPEQAKALLLQNHDSGNGFLSMGLYNVNRRIKLYYGRRYGLEIDSQPDDFTCITFRLPITIPRKKTEEVLVK